MTFKKIALVSTVLVALLSAGSANARGFFGDLIEEVGAAVSPARDVLAWPYCATQQGVFFMGPSWQPVDFRCNTNDWQGVVVQ